MSFRYPFAVVRPGFNPLLNPSAPTIGTATGGNTSASVAFTAPSNIGGSAITSYTVVSSGGQFNSGASSPITVSGLTNGVSYTFIVFATNSYGPGPNSAASNSVTPAPQYQLWAWGGNGFGQLGQGNTTSRNAPIQVGALVNWSEVNGSNYFSTVIKTDGTLWSWGFNDSGQLGLGNATYYSSPKQVGALTDWLSISSKYTSNVVAVKTNGTLWTWGNNQNGQLGLGNTTNYSSPKQVGALTNWSMVAGGRFMASAIKTDGTLWAWGYNNFGQLGQGNKSDRSSPVQIGSDTNWSYVSSTSDAIFATKTNGTLWAWGRGLFGQLGRNNTTDYSSPVQLGSLTNWARVYNGYYYVLAVKTDGTLWGWGRGAQGVLGLGNVTYYSSPKQVGALTNWSSVAAMQFNSMALKTDGTLWAIGGLNDAGQLGLGDLTARQSPNQVGSLTTWVKLSGGIDFALATKTP